MEEKVLALLKENRGAYLSGEEIAMRLSVSRAAVWKAVENLRAAGCGIEAATHRGYRLVSEGDVLTGSILAASLTEAGVDLGSRFYRSIDSTNNEAKRLASAGEKRDLLLVAAEQTAGRGRSGRSFLSPEGGLYMSFLLHPASSAEESMRLTTAAAVAVSETVEELSGKKTGIKWVNDVYLDGRKITGILAEASLSLENGGLEYAVVGIGVNLCEPRGGFDPAIRATAGAVWRRGEKQSAGRARMAAVIAKKYLALLRENDQASIHRAYKDRSLVLGREVTVIRVGREEEKARVLDIDGENRLVLQYPQGTVETLGTGEIRVVI